MAQLMIDRGPPLNLNDPPLNLKDGGKYKTCWISEEVGQGHVHKVSNCGVGQRKLTNQSIVMNRSCSQPDLRINLMQQGSRAGNVGSGMQLMS